MSFFIFACSSPGARERLERNAEIAGPRGVSRTVGPGVTGGDGVGCGVPGHSSYPLLVSALNVINQGCHRTPRITGCLRPHAPDIFYPVCTRSLIQVLQRVPLVLPNADKGLALLAWLGGQDFSFLMCPVEPDHLSEGRIGVRVKASLLAIRGCWETLRSRSLSF